MCNLAACGCITAETAFLVLDSEHDGDKVKDVNISYKDISSRRAKVTVTHLSRPSMASFALYIISDLGH